MPRTLILKCLLKQLNCLHLWYNFSCKHQKLSKFHSRFLETIHLHLFDIQVLILQTKLAVLPAIWVHLIRYGAFFKLTMYRCKTAYLLSLFSCTQNVFRQLNVIFQTFGSLFLGLLFSYSFWKPPLVIFDSNLFFEGYGVLRYQWGMLVKFNSFTNSNLGEMR